MLEKLIYESLMCSTILLVWFETMLPILIWEKLEKTEWRATRQDFTVYIDDFKKFGLPVGHLLTCPTCLSIWICAILALFFCSSLGEFFVLTLACPSIAIGVYTWLKKQS